MNLQLPVPEEMRDVAARMKVMFLNRWPALAEGMGMDVEMSKKEVMIRVLLLAALTLGWKFRGATVDEAMLDASVDNAHDFVAGKKPVTLFISAWLALYTRLRDDFPVLKPEAPVEVAEEVDPVKIVLPTRVKDERFTGWSDKLATAFLGLSTDIQRWYLAGGQKMMKRVIGIRLTVRTT